MRFKSFSLLLVATAVTSLAGSMCAAIAAPVGPSVSAAEAVNAPNAWFVELKNAPASSGTSAKALQSEKQAFRDAARDAGVKYTERMAFDTLWNGFSINASSSELAKIQSLPGVSRVFPVILIDAPERGTTGGTPDLYTAITMSGADIVQNELGYTGAGIRVAVMDTGIDVDHPAFGGDGVARNDSSLFPSARVAYGYDFVGDAFNADPASPSYNPVATPDQNPDDCAGHGTHVAGIVGANDRTNGLKGVAPEVTFGAYRVFGCEGSTTADIMIAAMERALKDGMQVLNMSIGSSFQWPQYPTAVAASRLVDRGMVVVASIGNSGTSGLYAAGAPGLGDKVIGTASFENAEVLLPYFTVNNRKIGYQTMTYSAPAPTSGSAEIVDIGRACNSDALAGNPAGKTALAVRGTCSFAEKALKAINAGATAVVIYNNTPGFLSGTLGAPIGSNVPVVGISQSDGLFLRQQSAPVNMTWSNQQDFLTNDVAGLISSFSSYGLSPDLALKPDIGAPGGSIYSSYPLESGAYAVLSGTSMASPHVAGAAALLLQAKPKTKAGDVRTILQNSADPKNWWGNPGLGFLDNVHRQGAGMVDIDDAILATTMVSPGKINVGEGEAGPRSQVLSIANTGTSAVTYDLTSVNALSTGQTKNAAGVITADGVVTPGFTTSDATVAFSASSVTVPAGGKASVTATITPATGPQYGQYGGYIVLTPQGGGQVYRVPFAGFVGDYQGIQAVTPTVNGFPWLAVLYAGSLYKVTGPADWVYSLVGDDVPYFLIHFEHQVQELQAKITDAKTGQAVHPVFNLAFDEVYLPRNSTSTGFFAFTWDGTRIHSNGYNGNGYTKDLTKPVADGEYVVEIRALKANGNPANPAHWETWTSPVIAIDRP
jgi:minor extracellular serine protease Vpr